jgi:hypothetical protein
MLTYHVLRIQGGLVMRDSPAAVEKVRDRIEALRGERALT